MLTHLNLVLVCDFSSGSKDEAPKGHDAENNSGNVKKKEEEERKDKARKKCLKSYSKKIK